MKTIFEQYKAATGNDLMGEFNTVSIADQAKAYKVDHKLLPGCSFSNYGLTMKFSSATNESVLDEIVKGNSTAWEKVDSLTYVFREKDGPFNCYYSDVTMFMQKLSNVNPPGLAVKWRKEYEIEVEKSRRIPVVNNEIATIRREMANIRSIFEGYCSCYVRIRTDVTLQRRQDIEERLIIDEQINDLNNSIQILPNIDELKRQIAEKRGKQQTLNQKNKEIDQEIISLKNQEKELLSILDTWAQEYAEKDKELLIVRKEVDRLDKEETIAFMQNDPNYDRIKKEHEVKLQEMYTLQSHLEDIRRNSDNLERYRLGPVRYLIQQAENQKKTNESTIEQLATSIEQLTNNISSTEDSRRNLESKLASKEDYKNALDERLRDIQSDIDYLLKNKSINLSYLEKDKILQSHLITLSDLEHTLAASLRNQESLLSEITKAKEEMDNEHLSHPKMPMIVEDEYYHIVNKKSGNALDGNAHNKIATQVYVALPPIQGNSYQRWRFFSSPQFPGYYNIVQEQSQKALDASASNSVKNQVYFGDPDSTNVFQLWRPMRIKSTPYLHFVHHHSQHSLFGDASRSKETQVTIEYKPADNNDNQAWQIKQP